jgi:purine-binding chemotaxis protein CheW
MAVPAETVAEVIRRPRLTRVPHAPPSLLGLTQLRGAPVPVVSLARLLGGEDAPATAASRLLLIDAAEPLAVSVDEVGSLSAGAVDGRARAGQVYLDGEAAAKLVDIIELLQRDFAGVARRQGGAAVAADSEAAPEAAREARIALMTFDIAGQAYALPLEQVAEVLVMPARVSALPGAEAAVIGVAPHRGRLLPLVGLRSLLGLAGAYGADAQIVITQLGGSTIGFVVDRLGSILRVDPAAIAPTPSVLNRGAGEAQIQSICRLPDGRGLVSMLSAERLFRDETVAQILAEATQEEVEDMTDETSRAVEPFVVFALGDEEYGLPLAAVEEVVSLPERLTRAPRAPDFVEGLINLRGKIVPVIDQRRRFQAPDDASRRRRRLIVTTVDDRPAAFIVDRVAEIVSVPADRITATPDLAADTARLFDRVATFAVGDRMILLVDPKALLDLAERDLLARMHAEAPDAETK